MSRSAPGRTTWWAWLLAIVFYDFCYYWNHRLGHESAVFWAAHVVHHQSQRYNLSTALRQTSSGALLGWIFYLPMAVAGVPPEMFAVAAIVDLLYQYWIHTELMGKLGWFDRWFASPSNHRVHHAVNDRYIDRNYGGIFMAWDRLFGTFVEEDGALRLRHAHAARIRGIRCGRTSRSMPTSPASRGQCDRWGDKLRVWLKPPGWQPAIAGAGWQKPAFDLRQVRTYDPPMTTPVRVFALAQIALAVLGSVLLLWYTDALACAAADCGLRCGHRSALADGCSHAVPAAHEQRGRDRSLSDWHCLFRHERSGCTCDDRRRCARPACR